MAIARYRSFQDWHVADGDVVSVGDGGGAVTAAATAAGRVVGCRRLAPSVARARRRRRRDALRRRAAEARPALRDGHARAERGAVAAVEPLGIARDAVPLEREKEKGLSSIPDRDRAARAVCVCLCYHARRRVRAAVNPSGRHSAARAPPDE